MGWLIALAVIIGILCIPLGIDGRYDDSGAFVYLLAGPVKILLFPGKSKKKETEKAPKDSKQTSGQVTTKQETEKNGGSYKDFLPLVQVVLDFLDAFRTKLRVNLLEISLTLAGGDPCDLAVNYGKGWAVLGNLMPQLERFLTIKKRKLQVQCDFVAANTTVFAHIILTITVGRLLHIGAFHGARAIYHYFKIHNQRKGGAKL